MPTRTINIDGTEWRVLPSGRVTANVRDEFGLIFVKGVGAERVVRLTRYSPQGTRWREASLTELTDAKLRELFYCSQPSVTAPETGYTP